MPGGLPKLAALLCLALLVFLSGVWGAAALAYFDHVSFTVRASLAVAFGICSLATLVAISLPAWRWSAVATYAFLFMVLVWRWEAIEPSNDRDWQPEAARLAYADIAGDQVTVHNIRNFQYRTETDFTPAYYDKTFELAKLDSVDLVASYWMGPAIAHIFLTFNFGDDHLAISIEARRERGEGYSSIQGFFRQYELYYTVADERDAIRLRTNYRRDPPEDVYLYRLQGNPEAMRRVFLDYMAELDRLKEHPEFYNSLTTNCTTSIWLHGRVNPGHLPFSWRILVSGYLPELLYENSRLDTSVPFAELQKRSHINARARAADQAADFSSRIRK
jgi:hypothetical protein